MRGVAVVAIVLFGPVGLAPAQPRGTDPHIASTEPLPPADERMKLHVPPGFEVQLVAAEPTIRKPINLAFDARGRLWVTGSEEYPFPAPPQRRPKDKLVILEDFAADGRARKVTVFADGLNIPIGVLPLPDCQSALVYSIPNIWLLRDIDGDGKADVKEALYTGFGYQDTHGMTGEFVWGFDGWVYCCHGFANTSHVKAAKADAALQMHSGNTFRIKPDGSRIEQFTWGQVNPFGLCFDPLGNLYSADCHSRPIYQLLRGAYYPSFGKPHDGLGFGPEMLTHDHGSTAIAGIAYYAADQYPKEFHDNLFVGNVVTNRINRDRIAWRGSTPKGIAMPDFVRSEDPWFRPVDIKLGPDGCLYVADFYTRIIGHYEVPLNHPLRDFDKGRVWRIVYRGPQGQGQPNDYRPIPDRSADELAAALGDPNLSVRMFAANELVQRGSPTAVEAVAKAHRSGSPFQQAHALWVLERLGRLSPAQLADSLDSRHALVRLHAVRILGERTAVGEQDHRRLRALLHDPDPHVRRAAAEALGRHPDVAAARALATFRASLAADDAHLLHVVRMALRNQFRAPNVAARITELTWESRAEADAVADACLGMPSADAARFLLRHGLNDEPAEVVQRRVHHIARHGAPDARAALLDALRRRYAAQQDRTAAAARGLVLGLQERGAALLDAERRWAEETTLRLLAERTHAAEGIELAALLKPTAAASALLRIVQDGSYGEGPRRRAIAALVAIEPRGHVGLLAELLVDDAETIGIREQAAAALAAANQPEAYTALVRAFEKAPARLQTTIALGMAGSPQGAERLLDAVAAGKASARLLQDPTITQRLRQAKVANLEERLAKLTKGLPPADQRLAQLLAQRRAAWATATSDVKLGQLVFHKHCAACHAIANQGAKIGPQLDGIGNRGVERLLEDILDPNRNVDQAFRATTLELTNGQLVTGLLLREEGKVLVLADQQGKEVRVEADRVANRSVGQLSPMPANFAELIPEPEFHHLLAYLLDQRAK
ncbi:MAG: HEAT repeat domain-containing protein [Gemmataceae bacterium]|nr:HEAT repeat domain-containing protein [Gemmataceae bacterium]